MISESRRRANDKYLKENYGKLNASYKKEYIEKVKAAAVASGCESFAAYIKLALDNQMAADGFNNTDDAE